MAEEAAIIRRIFKDYAAGQSPIHIAKALKELAYRSGKPFKQVVNETLRVGLSAPATRRASGPRTGVAMKLAGAP